MSGLKWPFSLRPHCEVKEPFEAFPACWGLRTFGLILVMLTKSFFDGPPFCAAAWATAPCSPLLAASALASAASAAGASFIVHALNDLMSAGGWPARPIASLMPLMVWSRFCFRSPRRALPFAWPAASFLYASATWSSSLARFASTSGLA